MDQMDNNVIVLGMGRTGRAVKEYLEHRGANVKCLDDSKEYDGEEALCRRYDYAVISPGIAMTHPAVLSLKESGVPILSELDLAYINSESRNIYAISGTNGKTTTSTILHALLSGVTHSHLVGNIGTPWISRLDDIEKGDAIVVETSSFQIEQSTLFRPYIAALTNVGEDHLDRHITAEAYQRIKLSLLDMAKVKVINKGDLMQRDVPNAISYSDVDPTADYYLSARTIYHNGKKYLLPISSRGASFDLDYLCAFAVASTAFGVKRRYLQVYSQVKIPGYRFHYVGTLKGAKVYNDSKGTNIDATVFAAGRIVEPLALILGGSDKGEDYTRLFAHLGKNVQRIYLTGANALKIYNASGAFRQKCRILPDLRAVVRDFVEDPLPVLLFSPASASFDLYHSYEERGRDFDKIFTECGGVQDELR